VSQDQSRNREYLSRFFCIHQTPIHILARNGSVAFLAWFMEHTQFDLSVGDQYGVRFILFGRRSIMQRAGALGKWCNFSSKEVQISAVRQRMTERLWTLQWIEMPQILSNVLKMRVALNGDDSISTLQPADLFNSICDRGIPSLNREPLA
jgi:hypothetical protein